jgi:hypothetical protein
MTRSQCVYLHSRLRSVRLACVSPAIDNLLVFRGLPELGERKNATNAKIHRYSDY